MIHIHHISVPGYLHHLLHIHHHCITSLSDLMHFPCYISINTALGCAPFLYIYQSSLGLKSPVIDFGLQASRTVSSQYNQLLTLDFSFWLSQTSLRLSVLTGYGPRALDAPVRISSPHSALCILYRIFQSLSHSAFIVLCIPLVTREL